VPWFIGGGAEHSPEVARLLAYAAFRGNQGIMGPGDLAVKPLNVPGPKVRVMPGACSILNAGTGVGYQAYAGRVVSEEAVDIAATGSGGGRSDLIVMRVEDPYMSGTPWQDPADPTVGPYIFPRVIPGVPASTRTVSELGLGYSAIELARVDLPANTATVTGSMIVDLRKVANPRRERRVLVSSPGGNDDVNNLVRRDWPLAHRQQIVIPWWATQAKIISHVAGAVIYTDRVDGYINNRLGTKGGQATRFDTNETVGANAADRTLMTADEMSIPANMRGTSQELALSVELSYRGPSGNGFLRAYGATTVVSDVEFLEVPEP
jgi:hypothetical protein